LIKFIVDTGLELDIGIRKRGKKTSISAPYRSLVSVVLARTLCLDVTGTATNFRIRSFKTHLEKALVGAEWSGDPWVPFERSKESFARYNEVVLMHLGVVWV